MRPSIIIACALAVSVLAGCVVEVSPHSDGRITILNDSSYVLTEVRVTEIDNASWGPNLLGDYLYPDERLTVTVACDIYDVLIADDFHRECVLADLDLCFASEVWAISNSTLTFCGF